MRVMAGLVALGLAGGLVGCAPAYTNTAYTSSDIGRTASISYGVIVSMRDVRVQGPQSGVGTLGGAAAGAAAGSFIGRNDFRANVIGAIGGAILGGLVGGAVENSASSGYAVEVIIREDNGQTISVVQTNEDQFRPGERVVMTRGARTRIGRAGPGV